MTQGSFEVDKEKSGPARQVGFTCCTNYPGWPTLVDGDAGDDIGDRLLAKATWYVDGEIKIKDEVLCPTPYDGP
jgi:hypothetical protein